MPTGGYPTASESLLCRPGRMGTVIPGKTANAGSISPPQPRERYAFRGASFFLSRKRVFQCVISMKGHMFHTRCVSDREILTSHCWQAARSFDAPASFCVASPLPKSVPPAFGLTCECILLKKGPCVVDEHPMSFGSRRLDLE